MNSSPGPTRPQRIPSQWGLLYWSLLGLGPCGGQPPLSWGQIMCILRILLPNCPPWVWGFLSMYIRLLIKYFLALTAAG